MPRARAAFVAFDTETTGCEVGSRLVELAAVAFSRRGKELSRFEALVDPDMPIPAEATAVHGIDDDMVADAPYVDAVMKDFMAWLPDNVPIMAHNATYDCNILSLALSQSRIPVPSLPVLDTLSMARQLAETCGNGLQTLVEAYGLPTSGPAHRALADVLAVKEYYCAVGHRARQDARIWRPSWQHPRRLPPQLAGICAALRQGRPWRCRYRSAQGNPSRPTIIPQGYARNNNTIVVHGMHTYWQEVRTLYADRIQAE